MSLEIFTAESFNQINSAEWNALSDGSPVLNFHFFKALEDQACIGADAGWQPLIILAQENHQLVGAIPLFLKYHSYGEYVFDWAWADAYARNNVAYYPKLLSAIPFTPVSGPRILTQDHIVKAHLAHSLKNLLIETELSSAHVLFTEEADSELFSANGWLERTGVQFAWHNQGYQSFESFLSTMTHDKRKKIHQERKKIQEAGITVKRLCGAEIQESDWVFFYQCYENTYHQHHSKPYLNLGFFLQIAQTLKPHIVLIVAESDGLPIASALNLFDNQRMYGRYWGATGFYSGLHFELCYYQGQEFCIERGIPIFEGGAQGEHKLARGFEPKVTKSYHLIRHPDFDIAIRRHVQRESGNMEHYHHELQERAPYKKLELSD